MKTFQLHFPFTGRLTIFLVLILAGCKKSSVHTPNTPSPTVTISPCRLTGETKNFQGTYSHYTYTYTKAGKLDSINFTNYPASGPIAWCKEASGGFLWISFDGTDGKTPNQYEYLYSGELQDSSNFPLSEQTSFQLFDHINTPSFAFNFAYNAAGKLETITELAPPPNQISLSLTGVTYSTTGDVSKIEWTFSTGPANSPVTTATIDGDDGHPSPYTGISGFAFLIPTVSWLSAEYDPLLYALSAHNPTGSVYGAGTSSQYSETMTYTYNSQGYPITRTVIRTNPDGSTLTYTHSYDYDCNF